MAVHSAGTGQGQRASKASYSPEKSGISRMDVTSNKDEGKTVSLVNGTMRFLYYESILQDSVRAVVSYSDSGETMEKETSGKTSAIEGLPIVGQENVKIVVNDNYGNALDATLYVNKVTPLMEDTTKSVVQLDLASKEYILNEKVRINKRFNGKIDEHIKSLLTSLKDDVGEEKFLGTQKELDIEPTSNSQNYIGNNKKPFYIINWLSRGAVPGGQSNPAAKKNSAGFLFFETGSTKPKDGEASPAKFHFKSIDGLMNTEVNKPKKKVIYNESTGGPDGMEGAPVGYDVKALTYTVDNKVNVKEKLKMGAYSTRLIMFNPYNCQYSVVTPNAGNTQHTGEANNAGDQSNLKLAGTELPALNKEFNMTVPGKEFSRTTWYVEDPGTLPDGKGAGLEQQEGTGQVAKSKTPNYKPAEVLNQGIMRLNQLFALQTTITIPGDFTLHAGDAIYVDAPQPSRPTESGKSDLPDKQTGGNYIISDLCHYMSPDHTLTKLKLVRDSFGRKPMER